MHAFDSTQDVHVSSNQLKQYTVPAAFTRPGLPFFLHDRRAAPGEGKEWPGKAIQAVIFTLGVGRCCFVAYCDFKPALMNGTSNAFVLVYVWRLTNVLTTDLTKN